VAAVATRNALLALGAAAVAVSASVHLHLWLDGYSGIATIGPLFLLQAIAGYALAIAILALRHPSLPSPARASCSRRWSASSSR
jgi:hypothetical protein